MKAFRASHMKVTDMETPEVWPTLKPVSAQAAADELFRRRLSHDLPTTSMVWLVFGIDTSAVYMRLVYCGAFAPLRKVAVIIAILAEACRCTAAAALLS